LEDVIGKNNYRQYVRDKDRIRVNESINSESIRVIAPDGSQLGIMTVPAALGAAREHGMDLVEVSPKSTPPVCRIMEYGKYKYEKSKRESIAKKKQTTIVVKEIKFRPKTDEHDYQFKVRHIKKFLEAKNKVKVVIRFRGREIVHMDKGRDILKRVLQDIVDIGTADNDPKLEGRAMIMMLSPK